MQGVLARNTISDTAAKCVVARRRRRTVPDSELVRDRHGKCVYLLTLLTRLVSWGPTIKAK